MTVSAPRVASLPNASFNVAVRSPEFTPAVLDEAPVRTMWSAAAALTVNACAAGLVREPSLVRVIDHQPAFSSPSLRPSDLEPAVIVNVDWAVPPVVLNAFAAPVELEA